MPTYEYSDGKSVREVVGSMNNPPPERVVFEGDGRMRAACEGEEIGVWSRVWGNVQFQPNPTHSRWPVASRTLPKNLPGWDKHGGYDERGRPVLRNAEDRQRACAIFGGEYVKDN